MTIPPSEIQRVIRQAQQGDGEAVTRLYQAYAQMIYRYVAYRVPTEADDLTAEVFLRMVEGLPRYRYTGAPFEAWLYRIAGARVADYHRRHASRPQVELTEQLPQGDPLPEERLLQAQEQATLRRAIQQLNEDQQNVLLLRFVELKTHDETARILGKSVPAVKSIQHRALTRLATLLGSEEKVRHYLRGRDE